MPRYFDRAGRQVSAEEALIGGAIRDGYSVSHQLREGESVGFDAAFMDGASRSSVFLTDTRVTLSDAESDAIVAQAMHRHHLSTGYLGDRAPPFTDVMAAQAVADAVQQKAQTRAFIDSQSADTARLMQADAEAARAQRDERYHNGWRR